MNSRVNSHSAKNRIDLFEKLAGMNASKRLELQEIYAHPWMVGPIYTPAETSKIMNEKYSHYLGMCKDEEHENFMFKMKHIPPADKGVIRTDVLYSQCLLECAEINARLSKQHLHPPDETTSAEKPSFKSKSHYSISSDVIQRDDSMSGTPMKQEQIRKEEQDVLRISSNPEDS